MTRTSPRWGAYGRLCVLLLLILGCSGEEPTETPPPDLGDGQFGDLCEKTEDCSSGLCLRVGEAMGTCTRSCESDVDCPSGRNWACIGDDAVSVEFCACRKSSEVEVCGDELDNDCDGATDDCRICNGEAVADDDPEHCRRCNNACRDDQECGPEGCRCLSARPDECGSYCAKLETDLENCGTCGNVCGPGQSCVDGECRCPEGLPDACAAGCTDLNDDEFNCGECDNDCPAGLDCHEGRCLCPDPEWTACGVACRDLTSDVSYCGDCETSCGAGQVCEDGACTCPADGGQLFCEGLGCVDGESDANNCGECGAACMLGTVCEDGACSCPDVDEPDFCDGIGCVDLANSRAHCGVCGAGCGVLEDCVAGECQCGGGSTACDQYCVYLDQDENHCGECGNACPSGLACIDGECSCNVQGYATCDGRCVDTGSDSEHCGACGEACAPGEYCESGVCFCDGLLCDGECKAFADPANCGACGVVCPAGQYCDGFGCRCTGGRTACGNVCEDLATSETSCGACGITCRIGELCTGGTCACQSGQFYCENLDRCVNRNTDPTNCGTCGNTCRDGEICSGGVCRCSTSGTTYCASAGACVSTWSDPEHCGACDNACDDALICSSGGCRCPVASQTYCEAADACVSTATDAEHCGACGNACDPTEICSSGTCRCPGTGETYCAAIEACVDTRSSDAHCGACGNACPAGTHCAGSACVCDDGVSTNCGGECALVSSDEEHCGTCDNACASSQICDAGRCRCPAPIAGTPVRVTNNALDDLRPAATWDGTHVGVAYARTASDGLSDLRFALLDSNGNVVSDGQVSDSVRCDPSNNGARPSLIWTGTEYGVLWRSTELFFTRLFPDGTPKAAPVALGNHYAPALAYSASAGTYAMAYLTNQYQGGFQFLGADASAPGTPNLFTSFADAPSERADTQLLLMADGRYVFAFRRAGDYVFALFNADGSRTEPIREIALGSFPSFSTDFPSLAQHQGMLYAASIADFGGSLRLNRGLQSDNPVWKQASDTIYAFADPVLAVAGDSLAFGVLERPDTALGHFLRLYRYALPATGSPVELHDGIDVQPVRSVSGGGNWQLVATSDDDLLAVWSDERWGNARELYAAPVHIGDCP